MDSKNACAYGCQDSGNLKPWGMFDSHAFQTSSLKGHLLLAMPQMSDPRFHRAVIYVVAHDQNGSMGLVINNPLSTLDFGDVLDQLSIDLNKSSYALLKTPVMNGGPVEVGHGFMLHTPDFSQKDTIRMDDHFSLSGTIDCLKTIATGFRPRKMIFTLGYAGWGEGQLEEELRDGAWMTVPASPDLVFDTPSDEIWEHAFTYLGANPMRISALSGRA